MCSDKANIIEVGPRDGLQNEPMTLDLETKIEFINALADTGLSYIEAGSFVKPESVPQLADSEMVFHALDHRDDVTFAALVPNLMGYERAIDADVSDIAIFTSPSETFNQKNINCSVEESLERYKPILLAAKEKDIKVRAYLSCVLGCPYEGRINPHSVADLAHMLVNMGCYQISLGDTIGMGTPGQVKQLLKEVASGIENHQIAVHFHDTRGLALANILASLELGIRNFDSSVAGLGGCPYAKGASGNVATEDVVYLLQGMGIETGVNLEKLISVGKLICAKIGRDYTSKVGNAGIPDWFYEKTKLSDFFNDTDK